MVLAASSGADRIGALLSRRILTWGLMSMLAAGPTFAQPHNPSTAPEPRVELRERFGIKEPRFLWITVLGDVRWLEDVQGLGPEAYVTFTEDALVVLEERNGELSREVRARRVGTDTPEIEYMIRWQEEPALGELDAWIMEMLDIAHLPEGDGTRATYDGSTIISVLHSDNAADAQEHVLWHAQTLTFSPYIAAQSMQLRSAGLADDTFVAEVARAGIVTLEQRVLEEAASRGALLENHVPWLLLTAYAVESDALRLELLLDIARLASDGRA